MVANPAKELPPVERVRTRRGIDALYGVVTPIFDKEMGRRLSVARMQMHLTQAKLGSMLGVSQKQISRLESGQIAVTDPAIPVARLAAVLNDRFSFVLVASKSEKYDQAHTKALYWSRVAREVRAKKEAREKSG